jgi:hypothetical protein
MAVPSGERLPLEGGTQTECGVVVTGHVPREGQRDLPGGPEVPGDLLFGDPAVLASFLRGQEGDEDVGRQGPDPPGLELSAAGETRTDESRRVRCQRSESRLVDVQVAGEGAADPLDRVADGRVDDGDRFVQETYQHVGGRRRVEGDAMQPQFTARVGHRVILPPRLRRLRPQGFGPRRGKPYSSCQSVAQVLSDVCAMRSRARSLRPCPRGGQSESSSAPGAIGRSRGTRWSPTRVRATGIPVSPCNVRRRARPRRRA